MNSRDNHWLNKVAEILLSDTGDLSALAEIAGEDKDTFYIGTDISSADDFNSMADKIGLPFFLQQNLLNDESWNELSGTVDSIRKKKHQGERFANFVELIYNNPSYAKNIYDASREKTKLGSVALAVFYNEFKKNSVEKKDENNIVFAQAVNKALRTMHALGRGPFVYHTATRVGFIREVNVVLRAFLNASWSMRNYSYAINQALDGWQKKNGDGGIG